MGHALLLLLSGCVLKAGGDGEADPRPDGAPTADALGTDGPAADSAPSDVGCSGVDSDVVAYLTMNRPENAQWPSLIGDHGAQATPPTAMTVPGPSPSCGSAFDASGDAYLVIQNSPDFDLDMGSFDLWVQVPAPGARRGFASRDANLTAEPGHIGLEFIDTNQILLRLQGTVEANRCSAPQNAGDWVHVGVNFGPGGLELYVDGVLADEPEIVVGGETRLCDQLLEEGIAGNSNPWLLGASAKFSADGSALPITDPLGTAIDEFRVSRIRRPF